METFESSYIVLQDYASVLIKDKGLFIDPCDLINDAFLELHTQPFSLQAYKAKIRDGVNIESRRQHTLCSENASFSVKGETLRICACCQELLPIAAFRLYSGFEGKRDYIGGTCNDCLNKNKAKRRGGYLKEKKKKRLEVNMELARDIINRIRPVKKDAA